MVWWHYSPKVETVNKKEMDSIFLLNRNLAPISLSRSAVRWVPPISGHYKLNMDVASPMKDGNWVLAAIVRDSGWWWLLVVGCWYQPIIPDLNMAEDMTLLVWMEFTKDMLFKDLEINYNSTNVIAPFNRDNMQHNYLGTIVLECSNLIYSFNNIVIAYIRR
jgi:hypothetical protein